MAFPSGGRADWVAGFAAGPIRGGSYDNAASLLEEAWLHSTVIRQRFERAAARQGGSCQDSRYWKRQRGLQSVSPARFLFLITGCA